MSGSKNPAILNTTSASQIITPDLIISGKELIKYLRIGVKDRTLRTIYEWFSTSPMSQRIFPQT